MQALAELYRLQPSFADAAEEGDLEAEAGQANGEQQAAAREAAQQRRRQREWSVQHVLLPALRWVLRCRPFGKAGAAVASIA